MKGIEKLANYFQTFPGIGPRQAQRFVYFLLRQDKPVVKEISELIAKLQDKIAECTSCHRLFEADGYADVCDICGSSGRDASLLMVVEKDADLESFEKGGIYAGRYFVLGGTLPLLENMPVRLRTDALKQRVETHAGELSEIILATGAHPEGELTADHVRSLLEDTARAHGVKITLLGRGLSTGTELEYSDKETLRNALLNRR
ncbi:MAG TPA: toprim domain-containing protein [Candidatus Paceibacterota bacterium]|nr:toprim domain-containing protein [Candidatus Paceibacterota bacterium]